MIAPLVNWLRIRKVAAENVMFETIPPARQKEILALGYKSGREAALEMIKSLGVAEAQRVTMRAFSRYPAHPQHIVEVYRGMADVINQQLENRK